LRLPLRIAAQVVHGPDAKPGNRCGIITCQVVQGARPIEEAGPDPMAIAGEVSPDVAKVGRRRDPLALTRCRGRATAPLSDQIDPRCVDVTQRPSGWTIAHGFGDSASATGHQLDDAIAA
jgi:hypothetical protein